MLDRPRLRPDAEARVVPGEGVFIVAEQGTALLSGRLYPLVVPLLDGLRTPREIAVALRDVAAPTEVYYALEQLERRGYAVESTDLLSRGEAALFTAQQIDAATAARRLRDTKVEVQVLGELTAWPRAALEAHRLAVADAGEVLLVASDDYLHPALEALNDAALASGRPWMLLRPVGLQLLIGPLFHPGRTGCWACLAARLRLTRHVEQFLGATTGQALASRGSLCATEANQQLAWLLGAGRLAHWIAVGRDGRGEGELLALDVISWQTHTHRLVRRPQCAACGQRAHDALVGMRPPRLEPRAKRAAAQGDHRSATAETTWARLRHHVSPYTGIVTGLEPVSAVFGDALHVYAAAHHHALRETSLGELRASLRHCSAGAGRTAVEARTSALCEALERHSAVFDGSEARVRGTLASLGASALHPNDSLLFSARQYQARERWNADGSIYTYVPTPFDPTLETDWTPLWSLTHGEPRYLPTGLCYFDVPAVDAARDSRWVACSNGSAAGATLEEAILGGLLEVVERDGVALWWYNRLRRPEVDLQTFDLPGAQALLGALRAQHRECWALDLTSDFGVPIFAALSRRVDRPREIIALGFGAHLDARVALSRALTEMSLMLAWPVLEAPAAIRARALDAHTHRWLESATVDAHPYLLPNPSAPRTTRESHGRPWTEDVLADIDEIRRRLEAQGHEVLVLDQTRPDLDLPVAKVVVPGLRHFWARLAPGRLYEVPVRLGWLPTPLTEAELNPLPMFV